MRITIDIPDELIRSAMSIYKVHTKKDAVIRALQERVDRDTRMALFYRVRGSMPEFAIDTDTLRRRPRTQPRRLRPATHSRLKSVS